MLIIFQILQRTFVLSRLMHKAEKKTEGGTDTMVRDEGEPSRHMGSEYENQATVEGISDVSRACLIGHIEN